MSLAASLLLAPPAIAASRDWHPGVHVRVVNEPLYPALEELRQGHIDFMVSPLALQPLPSSFRASPLFNNLLVVATRKGHPKVKANSLADLVDAEWVMTGDTGHLLDAFESAGLAQPRVAVQFESVSGLNRLIACTDLVAAMPRQQLDIGHDAPALTVLNLKERLRPLRVHLVTRVDVPLTPAAAALAAQFRRVARAVAIELSR